MLPSDRLQQPNLPKYLSTEVKKTARNIISKVTEDFSKRDEPKYMEKNNIKERLDEGLGEDDYKSF